MILLWPLRKGSECILSVMKKLFLLAFALLLLSPSSATTLAAIDWKDLSKQYMILLPSNDGTLRWKFKTQGGILSTPATAADGTVYITSVDGRLYAVDKKGTKKWAFATDRKLCSSPAVGTDGTVFFGTVDQKLYAIHPNGTLKWTFAAGDAVRATPIIGADGTVYVATHNGTLYALHPDGTIKWQFSNPGRSDMSSQLAIHSDDTLYVTWGYELYAVNLSDGKLKKLYGGWSSLTSFAIGADGAIYAVAEETKYAAKTVYAVYPSDGSIRWKYKTNDMYSSPPVVGNDGTVYVATDTDGQGILHAIKPDGSEKWVFAAKKRFFLIYLDIAYIANSTPAIGPDGTVYIGAGREGSSKEGKLFAIKPNGKKKWEITFEHDMYSAPTVGNDGTVYFGAMDGYLYTVGGITAVSEVNLAPTELTLSVGQSQQLTASVLPAYATYPDIAWISGDASIATVNDGIVTGVKPGKTTITAREESGLYKQCVVIVTEANAAGTANGNTPAPGDAAGPELALKDIDGHKANKEILEAVGHGIVNGYPDGTFRLDGNVTRAEFASMLMRGLKPDGEGAALTFKDKGQIGSWALKAVRQAVQLGIITGYTDGTFRSNANITRAELMVMVVRAAGLQPENTQHTSFEDDTNFPNWARPYIAKAAEIGIIISKDYTDHKFAPKTFATRAEAASAIVRMLAWRAKIE